MTITADKLLQGVKRRITMPANQEDLGDLDILDLADDVIVEKLIPLILGVNQNYYAVETDIPTVQDVGEYEIPERALGRALRDLKLKNGLNNIKDLSLFALEDCHRFGVLGEPSGFYFLDDQIVLVPAPVSAAYTLMVYYNMRPSKLVQLSATSKVTAISGDVVSVDAVPTTFVSGAKIDFIRGKSACRVVSMDEPIVSVAGTNITFGVGLVPTKLAVGDYIALAGYSPVLQVPDEAFPLLETCTAERCLTSIGDNEGAAVLNSKVEMLERGLAKVISPRVEGETTKIINRNGLLRGRGFSSRRRGGLYS